MLRTQPPQHVPHTASGYLAPRTAGRVPLPGRLPALSPERVDQVLAAVVLLAATAPFVLLQWGVVDRPQGWSWQWSAYLSAAGTAVPLIWRRRAPFMVWLCVGAAVLGYQFLGARAAPEPVQFGGLLASYTVAATARRGQWLTALALTVVGILLVRSPLTQVVSFLTFAAAYGLGMVARTRQVYLTALEERARRLEQEREVAAVRAAAQERARIARDMHDILAHAVSLMVVQAEAGPLAIRSNPERAEAAFDAIATAGRDAMVQVRRMLGVLKAEDGDSSAAGEAAHARAPQPTIASLPRLVEQVRATQLEVVLEVEGQPRRLPQDTELAAYRIVQEALTNTVKHADAGRVEVRLEWLDDAIELRILDDGRARVGRSGRKGTRPEPARPAEPPGGSGGNGLIGIHERAAACGGTASTGPAPDGPGYLVTAHLPYELSTDGEMAAR